MGQAKRRGTFEQRLEMALVKKYQPLNEKQEKAIKDIASQRNVAVVGMSPRLSLAALLLAVSHNPHKF